MSLTRQIMQDSPRAYWPLNGSLAGLGSASPGALSIQAGSTVYETDSLMGRGVDADDGDWTTTYRVEQSAYSVEAWAFLTAAYVGGQEDTLVGDWGGNAATGVMLIRLSDYWRLYHAATFLESSTTAPLNRWHQVVGTWDGSNLRLYQDGAEVDTGSDGAAPGTAAGTNTASRVNSYGNTATGRRMPGRIAHVAWWNTALSPERIRAHYEAGSRSGVVTG